MMEETKLCECGCGTVIRKWRHAGRELGYVEKRFAPGHHARVLDCFRGHRHTTEARLLQSVRASLRGNNGNRNLSNHRQGIPLTDEHRRKLRGPRYQMRGTGNPAWKGGAKDYRLASAEWQELRARVLLRDQFTCQRCGRIFELAQRRRLQVHHIVPFATFGPSDGDPNVLENLTTLCASCHRRTECEGRTIHGRA